MNAHAQIIDRLGRDVAGIVQDYVVNDNAVAMGDIIHRMNMRNVWRITDELKNDNTRWLLAFMNGWQDKSEVWPRVQAHIAILDQGDAFHLRFIEPGDARYDIRTQRYHVNFTHPIGIFYEAAVERGPGHGMVKRS